MPIDVRANLVRLTQREFAAIAYEVVSQAFAVHSELGSLFDETVYQNALAARLRDVRTEVRIDVTFRDFRKIYVMDAVVSDGAVFEFKAVKGICPRHRSQLLNYLLLAGLNHGKLINFGTDGVEHEFVNTSLTHADRTCFGVRDDEWLETDGLGEDEKKLVLEILRDWGTGLDCALYREALFHFLGGKNGLLANLDIIQNGMCVAQQVVPLCGNSTAVRLTMFQGEKGKFERDLIRFMQATRICFLQWINVARSEVTFKTLHLSVPDFSV